MMKFHPTAPFQITIDGTLTARPYWREADMHEAADQLIEAGHKHSVYVRNAAGALQHRIYNNLCEADWNWLDKKLSEDDGRQFAVLIP